MKINRNKRAHKHLQFYTNYFSFREPYQILFDGTFCFQALKTQFQVNQQLPKYFQAEIKPITTACIIIESDKLGNAFRGTTNLLKTFTVHRCGHEKSPLTGSECIKHLSKQSNYVIATQDRDLQAWIRTKAGIPLVYLHQVTPTLEPPSDLSNKIASRKDSQVVDVSKLEQDRLKYFKAREGLVENGATEQTKKRKVKGGANPLSCKKKKSKKTISSVEATKNGKVEKRSRKRIKISKHVKEILVNQ